MRNLEQIRAHAAIGPAGDLDRGAISKLPGMILANGLLAAAAFCDAEGGKENRAAMRRALGATAEHLAKRGLLPPGTVTVRQMVEALSERDSIHLQRATAEALAFIAYLKRFAPDRNH